jgi:hypothetical protein
MVKRALNLSIPAKYLLMDSLFRILSMAWNKVRQYYSESEQLALEIIEATMKEALTVISPDFIAKC